MFCFQLSLKLDESTFNANLINDLFLSESHLINWLQSNGLWSLSLFIERMSEPIISLSSCEVPNVRFRTPNRTQEEREESRLFFTFKPLCPSNNRISHNKHRGNGLVGAAVTGDDLIALRLRLGNSLFAEFRFVLGLERDDINQVSVGTRHRGGVPGGEPVFMVRGLVEADKTAGLW